MVISAICDNIAISIPLEFFDSLFSRFVLALLPIQLGTPIFTTPMKTSYRVGGSQGVLQISKRGGVASFSFSGKVCYDLRAIGNFNEVVRLFETVTFSKVNNQSNYRITRLDAAVDFDGLDTPKILTDFYDLNYIHGVSFYPGGGKNSSLVRIGGLSARPWDMRSSGTINIGSKDSSITARIYDKWLQLFEVEDYNIEHERIRYELTCRKDIGCSIDDVIDPTALFCHFMRHGVCSLVDLPDMGWFSTCPEWQTIYREPVKHDAGADMWHYVESGALDVIISLLGSCYASYDPVFVTWFLDEVKKVRSARVQLELPELSERLKPL